VAPGPIPLTEELTAGPAGAFKLAARSALGELDEDTGTLMRFDEPLSGPMLYTKLLFTLPVTDACENEPVHPGV
jgi:hypothetical protein